MGTPSSPRKSRIWSRVSTVSSPRMISRISLRIRVLMLAQPSSCNTQAELETTTSHPTTCPSTKPTQVDPSQPTEQQFFYHLKEEAEDGERPLTLFKPSTCYQFQQQSQCF